MKINFKTMVLALAAAMVPAGGAFAQTNWTGFSVGVGVGAGAINHDLTIVDGPSSPIPFAFGFDGIGGEGMLGTVGVAADFQVQPRVVVGLFLDYDFARLETDLNLSIPSFGGLTANGEIKLENQWTLGARVGMLATPETLWYALVGYTRAEVSDLKLSASGPLTGSISLGVPDMSGYVVGGGVETMLAPNWSVKAEYRFTQLDGERLNLPFGLNDFVNAELEPSIHTARISVNYKFNWDRARHVEPLK